MSERSKTFVERGGRWVVAQSALLALVCGLGIRFHNEWRTRVFAVVGWLPVVVGGYLGIAGVLALGRNLTPYPRPVGGAELIKRGVYGQIRHPIYTSVMLLSLGWSLLWQSTPALVATSAIMAFFHAKARREERWLQDKFPEYNTYTKRVPRFVPGFGLFPKD